MEIQEKDLGKIVELGARPEWGPGIITKLQSRFALILFRDVKEKEPKKYIRADNPLKLAANQDEPALVKRGRAKNKQIKIRSAAPTAAPDKS